MKINEIFKNENFTVNDYFTYCGIDDINKYFHPIWEIDNWNNYNNINESVEMFNKHFLPSNPVYIICDSDLDGITSTSILYSYMIDLAIDCKEDWDIQILLHNSKERGLQDNEILTHIKENPRPFIIIPDAGTNDKKQVQYLKKQFNTDILVLDHHDIETPIEDGILITNQKNNKISPNGSGCLVTYMFLKALDEYYKRNNADYYIDLVALSLISDSMDMSDQQNRTFYHYGLEQTDNIKNIFLHKTFEKFVGDFEYTQRDIAFKIVPKFNSVIRSDDTKLKQQIIECFIGCEDNFNEVLEKCAECHRNQIKLVDKIITNHKTEIEKANKNNIVLLSCDDMPRSYSGLVAGKIMNICNKPTIVGKIKDDEFIGSLRSPVPFRTELNECKLIKWAIGHENSCGVSFFSNNYNNLIDYYNTLKISYEPHIDVLKSYNINNIPDNIFSLFGANLDVLWGYGIPKPTFEIYNILYYPQDIMILGANKRTLKIISNGVNFLFFNITKQQKADLGLGYIVDGEFYDNIKSEKLCLSCIGNLSVNRYKSYVNNQMIVDNFEVTKYKPKTIESVFKRR